MGRGAESIEAQPFAVASRTAFARQASLIRARLLGSTILQSDETSVRVGNRTWWTWVFHHDDDCCFVIRPWVVAEELFRRLRQHAGVYREGNARNQPSLHDLRHTAAQHRLVAWYRSGCDVQRLLPQLATYLGHVDLSTTQYYLTMTPELLHEASQRFAHYAQPEQYLA
jgi:integrase